MQHNIHNTHSPARTHQCNTTQYNIHNPTCAKQCNTTQHNPAQQVPSSAVLQSRAIGDNTGHPQQHVHNPTQHVPSSATQHVHNTQQSATQPPSLTHTQQSTMQCVHNTTHTTVHNALPAQHSARQQVLIHHNQHTQPLPMQHLSCPTQHSTAGQPECHTLHTVQTMGNKCHTTEQIHNTVTVQHSHSPMHAQHTSANAQHSHNPTHTAQRNKYTTQSQSNTAATQHNYIQHNMHTTLPSAHTTESQHHIHNRAFTLPLHILPNQSNTIPSNTQHRQCNHKIATQHNHNPLQEPAQHTEHIPLDNTGQAQHPQHHNLAKLDTKYHQTI
ncbi:LIM domain-containing protein A-like [Gopherus evgoodei]|uniref:LIM domain-containing protein A-like n=1 Tax=Gopherus evgoodei TaxID=1825980 RepID=UPI0011CF644C|nr:LIM domain-containing protein A-like [Gopherus evgoodei]